MSETEKYTLDDLKYLMSRLRDPNTGCPWDLKQTYQSITAYTLEEVYEVVDAIDRNDLTHLSEELGDLLFQIVFYCQLAEEENQFNFDQVVSKITSKLVRRHPHVFPDGTLESVASESIDQQAVKDNWQAIKQQERHKKGENKILDDVPLALPALKRAAKLQKRAASVGFDWDEVAPVIEKVKEELQELQQEIDNGDQKRAEEELGDLLFSCVNLARHCSIDPERALGLSSNKFKRRFEAMEREIDFSQENPSLERMEKAWQKAKKS
jgi:ATP diphosphatase